MTRWLLRLPVHLAAVAFVWIFAGWLARWSVKNGWTTLPGKWALLHTTDDDLDGGQHQLGWPIPQTDAALVKQRASWLRRNPAGGVASVLLGIPAVKTRIVASDIRGAGDGYNWRKSRMVYAGKTYFEWRRDVTWCPWFYAKLWFGWTTDTRAGWHRFQCQVNPFRRLA